MKPQGKISLKYHKGGWGEGGGAGKKFYLFGSGHITKMAVMPIYNKHLKSSSVPEPLQQR